jgi:hypothetical protein
MMTLKRFKALADSYGAELRRWPAEARGDAVALLHTSARARLALAEAQALDKTIEAASAQEDAMLRSPDDQSLALARLRSGVTGRLTASSKRQPTGRLFWWASSASPHWAMLANLGGVGMATGGGFAIVAGLLIGSMYSPAPTSQNVLAILQSVPLQILADPCGSDE